MQTQQTNNNPWRTIVLTVGGIIALVFLWVFWQHSSADMRALLVGIVFGGLGGIPVGLMLRRRPDVDVTAEAYARGHGAGLHAGYCAAIAQDAACEVIVPQQQRELVPVRR